MSIDSFIIEEVRKQAAILERACEQAIQHGTYGVLALHGPNGTLIADENPHVPYGHLYEAPTNATTPEGLVEAWLTWSPR